MKNHHTNKRVVASLIPTGIRCAIGGYIGDATQATNTLAHVCDYLITNPNAINAGAFNFKAENVLYVEGFAIDAFFRQRFALQISKGNKIGLAVERFPDRISEKYFHKTIEAFQIVAGIDIVGIEYIRPLAKRVLLRRGQFCVDIKHIERMIDAGIRLRQKGAEAIALATHIPTDKAHVRAYQEGKIPNPYGFVEAMLSHAVVDALGVPSAHAPILTANEMQLYLFDSFHADPRSAFETISCAYIGSVLQGLADAPRLVEPGKGDIALHDIRALVIPANCFRSVPVMEAFRRDIPVIEVKTNKNIFRKMPASFLKGHRVYSVATYQEAARLLERL